MLYIGDGYVLNRDLKERFVLNMSIVTKDTFFVFSPNKNHPIKENLHGEKFYFFIHNTNIPSATTY